MTKNVLHTYFFIFINFGIMQASFGDKVPSFGTALIEQIKSKKSIILPIATGIIVTRILSFYYRHKVQQLEKEAKNPSIALDTYKTLHKKSEVYLKKYKLFSNISVAGTALFALLLPSIIRGKLSHF
jgi:hypothetical protein